MSVERTLMPVSEMGLGKGEVIRGGSGGALTRLSLSLERLGRSL